MAVVKVKKRLGSKKNKKAWRKTDIQDVEDFLEDKRLEEILGVEDRQNDELFTIDTSADSSNLSKYEGLKKERRQALLSKTPRCYQILEPHSKVPDPISKRNRVRTPEERKNPLLRQIEGERRKNGALTATELGRIRNRIVEKRRKANRPVRGEFLKDIWDEDDAPIPSSSDLNSEWILPSTKTHNLSNLDSIRRSLVSKAPNKPQIFPAVEVPHPGMSYNPSYTDHVDLLQKIAEAEQKLIKEEQHIKRVTVKMFKKLPQGSADALWMKEMSEGVPELDPEAAEPNDVDPTDDNEYHAINPPTNRDKKKDLKTRRKAREENAKRAQILLNKLERKKLSDVDRLKELQVALAKAEEKSKMLHEKMEAIKARKATETKRLGRNKFQEREPEFNLASELKGSLRTIKPEGNLLADRFISFQKRNIMEVEARQNSRRKTKKKKYFKGSHKMLWEINPLERSIHERKKLKASAAPLGQKS